MAQNELVLIAKANASGIRRQLYRNSVTSGKDEWSSDKLFDKDPDAILEFLYDTIQDRQFLAGTDIDDGWTESVYDTIVALIGNYQPGTRNQIRVEIQEHTDPDDEEVFGRLYAKIWGHGISETEIFQNLMRPAPPPPDAAFPDGYIDTLLNNTYTIGAGELFSFPMFDYADMIGQDLILNLRFMHNGEDIKPWANANAFTFQIPAELEGEEITLELWLNSSANGITNAYDTRVFTVGPPAFLAPAFPENWVAQYMFQKTLRANEPFEFNVFDSSTVIGSGNLTLSVKFTHDGEDLTTFEFVDQSNYTPPVELVNEGITLVFSLSDGEGTATDTFLLAVQPPIG